MRLGAAEAPLVRLALLFLVMVADMRPAAAEQLVLALSTEAVRITSNFTGTGITIFGAIERDAATVSRGSVYEIVVVVRGPGETLVTRRKDRFAGIWLNSASRTFVDMPSFYSVLSSRPLDEISTPETLEKFQLGFQHLDFRRPAREARDAPDDEAFREGFVRLKEQSGLYRHDPYGVTFPGESVFQATVQIPANVPVGLYRVSVFLFRDQAMLATNSATFGISKEGFEQFTFDLARQHGYVYGLVCVLLALFTGWLAGVLFRRD